MEDVCLGRIFEAVSSIAGQHKSKWMICAPANAKTAGGPAGCGGLVETHKLKAFFI